MNRENIPEPVEQNLAIAADQTAFAPTPETFAGLPVTRLEFVLRAEETAELPNFLGSTLRGAFGYALKRAACLSPGRICQTCPLPHDCWYAWLFETVMPPYALEVTQQRDAPRPFVLTPPLDRQWRDGMQLRRGAEIAFTMTLFGSAINGSIYAAHAIGEMAERGLGSRRGRFSLREIHALDKEGKRISLGYNVSDRQFDPLGIEAHRLSKMIETRLATLPTTDRVKLRFLTRARLRVQGQLQDEFRFSTLIRFLWRRAFLMLAVHGSEIPTLNKEAMLQCADEVNTLASAMMKHEVWRRSNRQGRQLPQDGFLGEVVFEGKDLPAFLPLLLAGELLHVGSGATFGLGKYEIVV
ncbi:MAG: CRISPR system precrRNA processing endoribonuclease RAMP protein Cas6 [Blastocatellia bacterium]